MKRHSKRLNKLIYLDNAASTKLAKSAYKAMEPFFTLQYGNPSSLHDMGHTSRQAIEQARTEVTSILGLNPASSKEVIFTAGGTESINLAIFGVAKAYQAKHHKPGHMIVSSIEHEAVLECIEALQKWGWKIDFLNVNKFGQIDIKELQRKVKPTTALVSVMYANNEVGTIQPIAEIGKVISGTNRARFKKNLPPIYFHTDACQAGGVLDLDVTKLKVDLLTLNGSKISGPKGSGILYIKSGTPIEPVIYGGGQERGLRSGTENTPAIIGFAKALTSAQGHRKKRAKYLHGLQTFLEGSLKKFKNITINGPVNNKFVAQNLVGQLNNFELVKLPSTTNFTVKGIEGEALMYYLNSAGFAVATGSACTTGSEDPSHVLLAMGLKQDSARSTIRISLSEDIKKADLVKFLSALKTNIELLQRTTQEL